MSSTITFYSNKIDINYPVAGQDNDTQGFRDNFTAIQNAFLVASSEISNLQDKGVKLTETNDLNYNTIKNVNLQNTSELVKSTDLTTVSTSYAYVNVNFDEATYHKFNLTLNASSNTYAFTVINWPASGKYGRVYLELKPDSANSTTVSILGNSRIIGANTSSVTFSQTGSIFYELWSIDNGANIFGTITN